MKSWVQFCNIWIEHFGFVIFFFHSHQIFPNYAMYLLVDLGLILNLFWQQQRAQLGTLRGPKKVGWRSWWEEGPKERGYMYTYSWFTLLYSRNQHNIVKQLSPIKQKKTTLNKQKKSMIAVLPISKTVILVLYKV